MDSIIEYCPTIFDSNSSTNISNTNTNSTSDNYSSSSSRTPTVIQHEEHSKWMKNTIFKSCQLMHVQVITTPLFHYISFIYHINCRIIIYNDAFI